MFWGNGGLSSPSQVTSARFYVVRQLSRFILGLLAIAITGTALAVPLSVAEINKRSYQYDRLIIKHARSEGIPASLVYAVMRQESGFDRNIISPVGAKGLMQLMPATARRFGVKNPFNAEQNIRGGTRYLAWLLKRFKGNVRHALAGYNAGEGKVDKYHGVPPYKETQNYVKRVMGYYRLYAGLSDKQKTPDVIKNKPVIHLAKKTSQSVIVIQNNKRVKMKLKQALLLKRSIIKKTIDRVKERNRIWNQRREQALRYAQYKRLKQQKQRQKTVRLAKATVHKTKRNLPRIKQVQVNPARVAKLNKPSVKVFKKHQAVVAKQTQVKKSPGVTHYKSTRRVHSITIAMNNVPPSGYTRIRATRSKVR